MGEAAAHAAIGCSAMPIEHLHTIFSISFQFHLNLGTHCPCDSCTLGFSHHSWSFHPSILSCQPHHSSLCLVENGYRKKRNTSVPIVRGKGISG